MKQVLLKCRLFLVLLLLSSIFLNASENIEDKYYTFEITNTYGSAKKGYDNAWQSGVICFLDNGLELFFFKECDDEFAAQNEVTYLLNHLHGKVSISKNIEDGDLAFYIQSLDYPYFSEEACITINPTATYKDVHYLTYFREDLTVSKGWIYDSYAYEYYVELDDGSAWQTSTRYVRCDKEWISNSRIILVGSKTNPTFINIDSLEEGESVVSIENYLCELEKVRG
jgi:hypothetical protein